jgi:hypothetical protein
MFGGGPKKEKKEEPKDEEDEPSGSSKAKKDAEDAEVGCPGAWLHIFFLVIVLMAYFCPTLFA